MKTGTKLQGIILFLLCLVIYSFWLDIAIGMLHIYSLTGHPHSKRMLGEYYAAQAHEANSKAATYFQQALVGYKIKLPGTAAEHRRWIEFLIGNQYEYGKGVSPNLAEAKIWYQKAINSGLPSGKTMFEQLNEALVKANKGPAK